MNTHFHGSHEQVSEIRSGGVFAAGRGIALSHGPILHFIESPRPLSDYALNYEIEGAWEAALEIADGNEAVATAIMSSGCEELADCAPEDRAEQGWEFQRLRGLLAERLGYTSVEMLDEHGTTWLCLPGCSIRVATDDDA